MKKILLDGFWKLKGGGYECEGTVPGSVLSALIENGIIDDPYYRDNEDWCFDLLNESYEFSRDFNVADVRNELFLCCEGLDTLANIYINENYIASTKNMHRAYRFDVSPFIKPGENSISIKFAPVDKYFKEKDKEFELLGGSVDPLKGFGHLRKAHCMSGWDWGPKLPDMGIWKSVYLLEKDSSELTEFDVKQRIDGVRAFLTVNVRTDGNAKIKTILISPDGNEREIAANRETEIDTPEFWWVRGLGEQPLYTVTVFAIENGNAVDEKSKRFGLRTIKLVRKPDEYGESYYHEINGVPFFAMGANYIPQDCILSRITEQRTRELLENCVFANFNTVRVWGGGYYPEDYFFDICDELGIAVYLDLAFSCSMYNFDEEMLAEVTEEVKQNVSRICNHPSLALICGNNEIEHCYYYYGGESKEKYTYKKSYEEVFERLFPHLIDEICPEIPYVSSSPTTHGGFVDPQNESVGDTHYWDVWHECKPIREYRKHYFRYLSEFGFQSFPSIKTIAAVTMPDDRNIFSYIMEKHQRNGTANGKVMSYLSQTFLYPTSFDTLIYASQLLQAEAMRIAVEHLRANRGRCMGALYWQLNDVWPVVSWSSIDYYGRFKALHYFAKRFFSPVLISCEETGESDCRMSVNDEKSLHPIVTTARISVANDTTENFFGKVIICLRDSHGREISRREEEVFVPKLGVKTLEEIDYDSTDYFNNFVSYELVAGGKIVSGGTALFTNPKFYKFADPNLRCDVRGDEITVYADNFAKFVEVYSDSEDFVLSDNFFDIYNGEKTIKILKGNCKNLKLRSAYDIK